MDGNAVFFGNDSPEFMNDLFIHGEHESLFDLNGLVNDNNFELNDPNFIPEKKEIQHSPFRRDGPPDKGDFEGDYKFRINISGDGTDKRKYLYSKPLNKVFLCMLTEMPIEFTWDWQRLRRDDLWIRATLVLASTEQQECRVMRCFNHRQSGDMSNRDVRDDIIPHILRSARQTDDVVYCGTENQEQQWLSVAIPVEEPSRGVNAVNHVYKFCCKHSCTSGINRRRIEVLFTLEDSSGEIYGRKSLGVRVCSNPRRDMDKEQEEFKLRSDGGPSKKRKMMTVDSAPMTSHDVFPPCNFDMNTYNFNFQVVGLENYYFIIRSLHDHIAGQFINLSVDHPLYLPYKEKLVELEDLMKKVPRPS